jgi:hypothetical protein
MTNEQRTQALEAAKKAPKVAAAIAINHLREGIVTPSEYHEIMRACGIDKAQAARIALTRDPFALLAKVLENG